MTVATLAYATSSHAARVLDPIARVAAASRVRAERLAREARADAEHARIVRAADLIRAELVAEHGEAQTFGVKVCADDAKWRATDVTAEWLGWILASESDVEYWEMNPRWDMREV